eukprot:4946054-Amphidinium_carterae.2
MLGLGRASPDVRCWFVLTGGSWRVRWWFGWAAASERLGVVNEWQRGRDWLSKRPVRCSLPEQQLGKGGCIRGFGVNGMWAPDGGFCWSVRIACQWDGQLVCAIETLVGQAVGCESIAVFGQCGIGPVWWLLCARLLWYSNHTVWGENANTTELGALKRSQCWATMVWLMMATAFQ